MTTGTGAEVRILSVSECWTLLRSVDLGRLAVLEGDGPEVFPINFVVDHGTLIFRSADGTKLTAATTGKAVAFEADCRSSDGSDAWSVVVKGTAQPVAVGELLDSVALPLWPVHPGVKPRFVRIVPTHISGRRFAVVDPAVWRTPWSGAHRTAIE